MERILAKISGVRLLVLGDVMLDETIHGSLAGRASDPQMVVIRRNEHFQSPGGAANAAANAASLGASVVLAGVIGADEPGKRLCRELTARSIDSSGLFVDSTRPTTSKISVRTTSCRYRLDHESRAALPEAVEESLFCFLEQRLPGVDACLVSDYAKGVVSAALVARLLRRCAERGIPVVVDPKGKDLNKYHGATLLKPNLEDAADLLQRHIESDQEVLEAGRLLTQRLGCPVLLTRGPHGVSLFQPGAQPQHMPALACLVTDVTGAGDTVAAVLTVALAAGASLPDAVLLASRAAAVVVGLSGTVAVRPPELLALAEVWPAARQQLCVFHILKDINDLILKAVRRLARQMGRRGNGGRKRKAGRPSKKQQASRAAADPTLKEKSSFIRKHRFLIVKKHVDLDKEQWSDLTKMFSYLPQLRTLWNFAGEVRGLFEKEARVQTLWKRRAALMRQQRYHEVPELAEAMEMLEPGKFTKMVAFTCSAAGQKIRTNNHVERLNRWLRFFEKLRYKWRRRKWVLRFVLLALDRCWRQAARAAQKTEQPAKPEQACHASSA